MLRQRGSRRSEIESVAKARVSNLLAAKIEKIEVENVNHPGSVKHLDADMYEAMKRAFLKTLPKKAPGLTVAEIQERVVALLPEKLFPKGARSGWWAKTVQLDLEAKRVILREKTTPFRLHKA